MQDRCTVLAYLPHVLAHVDASQGQGIEVCSIPGLAKVVSRLLSASTSGVIALA